MYIKFPKQLDVMAIALRAMYVEYDHFSSQCHNYMDPKRPEELDLGKYP